MNVSGGGVSIYGFQYFELIFTEYKTQNDGGCKLYITQTFNFTVHLLWRREFNVRQAEGFALLRQTEQQHKGGLKEV